MDAYKPQFDAYWTPDGVLPEAKVSESKPVSTASLSMEAAREELAQRVHAARCIV